MADASDSKSDVGDYVWVQVPSPAWVLYRQIIVQNDLAIFYTEIRIRERGKKRGKALLLLWGHGKLQDGECTDDKI